MREGSPKERYRTFNINIQHSLLKLQTASRANNTDSKRCKPRPVATPVYRPPGLTKINAGFKTTTLT